MATLTSAEQMTTRYRAGLWIVAALAAIAYLTLLLISNTQAHTDDMLRLSNQQHLLSQRIALLALRLTSADAGGERDELRQSVRAAAESMRQAHAELIGARTSAGAPDALDQQVRAYLTHAMALSTTPDAALTARNPHVIYLLQAAEDQLQAALNEVVQHYTVEKAAEFRRLELMLTVLLGLILSTLVLEARLIFRPMVRRIQEETQELIASQTQLRENEQRYRELFSSAQRQARELELLDHVRSALASEIDLSQLFRAVVEAIPDTFGYALVSLYIRQGDALLLQHQVGYPEVIELISLNQGVCWRVMQSGEALLLEDVRTDPAFLAAIDGITSEICIPLFDQGRTVGVLNVESIGVQLTMADLLLMSALSQQIGIAIGRARLYAEVRQERDFSSAVVDTMSSLVIVLDDQGRIVRFNRACERTTGYLFNEVVGRYLWDLFFSPEERPRIQATFHQLRAGDFPIARENEWRIRDGRRRLIDWTTTALLDATGTPRFIVGTGIDITERRQAEQALAHERDLLQAIMDHIPDTIYFKDRASRFTRINKAQARVLGIDDPAQAIGRTDFDFQGNLARTFYLEERHLLASKQPLIDRLEYNPMPDGQPRWFSATKVPLFDQQGRAIGIVGISRDVTERKRYEDALSEARDQALEASRLKSDFLATMSHEIRTPMNGIIGMTELLIDTPLNGEQREFAGIVHDSAQALLTIINDILDFSKIEAGKFIIEHHDFDLSATVESTAELLGARARAKRLTLMAFVDPMIAHMIRGDAGRLRQVLLNLIGNAVKFTQHGEVVVRAELEHEDTSDIIVRFTVQDTGIGISESAQRLLFQPFTQADSSVTRKYGGTGLGLAISRRLVELMGGEIGVESAAGQGSTFWFTVRFARATSAPVAAQAQIELSTLRVLVVDDNQTHREILQRYLRAWDMHADAAGDGRMALETLRAAATHSPYDLAIIDMAMPEMDGFALARALQRDPALARTRLILLTAFDERGQGDQANQAGFAAYLTKPVKRSQLFDAIAHAMVTSDAPAPDDPAQRTSAPAAMESEPANTRMLLLVEDNQVNQQIALRQLQKLGYTVQVVANGREAVAAVTAAEHPYALLLMDCQMPEMDGFAASRAIRELERADGRHVPIIAMTANAMQGDREACLAAGMDDYLSKPIQRDTLQGMLARWLPADADAIEVAHARAGAPLDTEMIASLRELLAGDADDGLAMLIDVFLDDANTQIAAIGPAIQQGDATSVYQSAHRLRGGSAHLGATALAAHCAELEALARAGTLGAGRIYLERIQREFERVQQALEAERALV